MTHDSAIQANHLLQRFYAAEDDADNALETLLACVRPAIRQRLSQKGVQGEDREELCGQAVSRLIEAARRSQTSGGERIGNFPAYALSVACCSSGPVV
jgi:hypothetical protein